MEPTPHAPSPVDRPSRAPGSAAAQVPPGAEPLAPAALTDIVAGLATVARDVPASSEHPPGEPRSLRLIATGGYDVWLITWPAHSEMGRHDHGEAASVMQVVHGSLVEQADGACRRVGPGTSVETEPGGVHRIANVDAIEVTSIHAYAPPLREVGYHDPDPGDVREGEQRVAPIRSRRAEATSGAWDRASTH